MNDDLRRSQDHLARVSELFSAAKELPAARRAALLDERCGGDAALRAEVAALLELETGAGDFLERPADPWVGQRIDRWRVLERIGAGGMGVVYKVARDDGVFEQQLALKLLRRSADHPEMLERFRRERQVLAALAHENIARLVDGGETADGVPYFVMEHVAGTRLDDWCDARRLPLARRLALFRAICAAVQYAHQNLVVHRDLKPGNVLVTDDGTVKLVDFGIAKVLDDGSPDAATRTVERRMTPEYSSPELVRGGAITTASDVFSLGVILYELTTGARPWRSAESSTTDLERAMSETTPPRPSAGAISAEAAAARGQDVGALRRALRGDLDAIVLTALAAEPERRYASVEQLAADVDRHLKHEPVVARAPGAAYLLSRWVRRHRALVAASVVALLALAAGAAGLVRGSEKARREAESTQRVNTLLREMLVQLEPTSARGFESSLQRQLHFANQELEKGLLKDEPGLELDLRLAMGRVYGSLGYPGWASEQFEKALELARRAGATRDARYVQLLRCLGWAKRSSAQYAAAEERLRAAIALARELGGPEDELGLAQTELGLTLTALRRFDDADAVLDEARAQRKAAGSADDAEMAGLEAASALNRLERGDTAGAEAPARATLALARKLFPKEDPRQALALETLARVLRAKGELEEAETLLDQSLEIRRALYDSKNPVIAWSLALLADVQCAAGRANEAVPLLEEALAIRKLHFEADSAPRMESLLQLGLALIDAGEPESALKPLREALAIADRRHYTLDPRLPRARQEFARLLSDAAPPPDAANAPKGGH
jgi:serine/threonine-protein kinase